MKKKTFIDLFCGCGGFSLGANLAGYTNLLSVDVDPILTSSYSLNFPKSNLHLADLGKIPDLRVLFGNPKTKPSLLIGGPPCQGFSFMGKRNPTDPRNELIWHFFRHVSIVQPDVFILENVEGLASGYGMEIINAAIDLLPNFYQISKPIQINASDFGAATVRPRVLLVGYDSRYVDDPQMDKKIKPNARRINVRDAIVDLPRPVRFEDDKSFDWVPYNSDEELSPYARALRKKPEKNLGWAHAVHQLEKGYVSGLTHTEHSEIVRQRFKETKQGEVEPVSRYFRLNWNLPSRTIRAGTGKDKGGFQAARPIHPSQSRVITVREAARIQGFPDWFVFHPTKWHSFRMIGNSVSPIMAKGIIKKL